MKIKDTTQNILYYESFSWFFLKILQFFGACALKEDVFIWMNVSEMSQYVENVIRLKDELIRDHFRDVNVMYFDVIYVYYTREHGNSIEVVDFFGSLNHACVFVFSFRENEWLESVQITCACTWFINSCRCQSNSLPTIVWTVAIEQCIETGRIENSV